MQDLTLQNIGDHDEGEGSAQNGMVDLVNYLKKAEAIVSRKTI